MRQRTKHPATKLTGMKLRELREKAGMTLRELANHSMIDFTYIKKIELGVSDPSIITLEILLQAMDLNLQDFFDSEYEYSFLQIEGNSEKNDI